jgi:mannan endo-1,4-beta-mannosidase
MSRRAVLASLSLGALALVTASNACRSEHQPRVFGLAANGIDDAAVKQGEATAQSLGRRLDVLTVYDAFGGQVPLPTELLDRITALGTVPIMTWEPWNPTDGVAQALYSAAQIAGGRYDAYVATWAKQAGTYNRHFLIRFAHEMNGDWYPWSVGQSGGTSDDYVAAYRRVRRIFDDSGAKQVQWVWSPNIIINGNTEAISRCYPGDDYVDIIEWTATTSATPRGTIGARRVTFSDRLSNWSPTWAGENRYGSPRVAAVTAAATSRPGSPTCSISSNPPTSKA